MSYRTLANWPPVWIWRGGDNKQEVRGEIGVLIDVIPSIVPPSNRIFLVIEHEDSQYMGCLLFDDPSFCRDVFRLLQAHLGLSIRDIGGLDLSCSL